MAQGKGEEITGALKHMKKSGALRIVIFAFAAGIILLMIGSGFTKSQPEAESNTELIDQSFKEYSDYLSSNISTMCRSVSGAGQVYVMISFEDSGELVYAQNTSGTGNDARNEYVIVGSGSSASALYLGQRFPKLSGIGVVCTGGSDPRVKDEICSLLSGTFSLPLTRIYVAPLA